MLRIGHDELFHRTFLVCSAKVVESCLFVCSAKVESRLFVCERLKVDALLAVLRLPSFPRSGACRSILCLSRCRCPLVLGLQRREAKPRAGAVLCVDEPNRIRVLGMTPLGFINGAWQN